MTSTRRDFIKTAGMAVATAKSLKPRMVMAQPSVKIVQTDVLEIAYEEHGPSDGFPIILVHGFPYDVRSFDGVPPSLVDAGYRVLLPYIRGYGQTRFLDLAAPRMAEQAAIAQDLIDFADALGIDRFAAAGFDWGNRAICIAAILNPDRVTAQVACGGYSVQDTITPGGPAPARFEALLWYQWYLNTERGIRGLTENRHDIIRYLWDTWSPAWNYSDEDYARSAPSFDNPDFVDICVHSYRHRHVNAPGEQRFLEVERRLAERPRITTPAIVLRAAQSGFGPPSADPSGDQARFSNLRGRRIVEGAGHDLPAHRPDAVADALLELLA
ncbi:MAG: alpha/beta hydrolase [Gammaproteobacteria bacterium]|nr:alpha/beta hydrolase [Gammaproteobacteria bacterium]MDD9895443.1 alpha/beta hydrolase [Gammaproteobacteria bacterium]MDD9957541.1 alpha/beta hydrolase [Gammaproteobacteria bacterium]